MGNEGVRSMACVDVGVWLSIDDSVFERLSMRFASFEGDGDGEAGVMESKIRERSRAGFGEESCGVEACFRGEPYVILTFGLIGKDSSTGGDILRRLV